jgi:type II secretory pathway pseudopilin PulG
MVVVLMVGIMVVLALPSIAYQLKSRRTSQAAAQIMQVYRGARSLAMGRGSAVMVSFNGTKFRVFEALSATSAPDCSLSASQTNQASPSCTATNWDLTTSPLPYREYISAGFDPGTSANTLWSLSVTVSDPSSTSGTAPVLDLCFSPTGRTFYRGGGGATSTSGLIFTQFAGAVLFSVTRADSVGARRLIIVPTGGNARLGA